MRIAIVGAGVAGLTAARYLQSHFDVHVFEKSRGVGGRLATRSRQGLSFDMGAQFFTVKDARFADFLQPLIAQQAVKIWRPQFVEIHGTEIVTQRQWAQAHPHFVGTPKMTSLAKYLAQGLQVSLQHTVTEVTRIGSQWRLFSEDHPLGDFDAVVFAAPVAQTLALLPSCCEFKTVIADKKMLGCYALMLGFDALPTLPWQAALVKNNILSWVSVNHSKPQRQQYSLVALASNAWADAHMDLDLDSVSAQLLAAVQQLLPIEASALCWQDCHRWRYANIAKQNGQAFYADASHQLYAVGDWCIQGRVEAAFLSGYQLAQALI